MRTAKTLIRMGGCPGLSESSLDAHATLLVLSRGGSNASSLQTALHCLLAREKKLLATAHKRKQPFSDSLPKLRGPRSVCQKPQNGAGRN